MPRVSLPDVWKITGVGMPAAGGGYWLAHLVGVSEPQALIIGGVLLAITSITAITAILPRIIEIIFNPEARRAKSEAFALRYRTKGDLKIAKRAAKKATVEQTLLILRQRAISPDLPAGRRLRDDALDRQQALPKNRFTVKKPGSPPTGSNGSGAAVLPFPPDEPPGPRRL